MNIHLHNITFFVYKIIKNRVLKDILILGLANLGLAAVTWLYSGRLGGGDWPTMGAGWFQGSEPLPPYWGSGQLFTGGVWSIGVDGAMFGWFSVSTTIAMYIQKLFGLDAISNYLFFLPTPIALGIFLVYPYMHRILGPGIQSIVASLCYSWSSHQITGVNGGQWLVVGTASALPLLLWALISIYEDKKQTFHYWMFFISVFMISCLDPRFIFVAVFPTVVILFVTLYKKINMMRIADTIYLGLLSIAGMSIAQAPWLSGMLFGSTAQAVPADRLTVDNVYKLSILSLEDAVNLRHSLWLTSLVWNPADYHFLSSLLNSYFIIITIGLWIGRRSKFITTSGIIYIIGVLFSKGSNDPLNELYTWLFKYAPGFMFFRDPAKWFILASLGAAPIVGHLAGSIGEILRNTVSQNRFSQIIAQMIIIFYVVGPILPILSTESIRNGSFTGDITNTESLKLNTMINENQDSFRSLVIPWGDHQIEHSENHQTITLYHLLGGSWSEFVPYGEKTIDQYKNLLSSPFFKTLLKLSNVRYIIVPDDREGVVFGRELNGFGSDVPGFIDTVSIVESLIGIPRKPEYVRHGVFELPSSEPIYVVETLRTGTRDTLQNAGLQGSWPISDGYVGAAGELILAVPTDDPMVSFEFHRASRVRYVVYADQLQPTWLVLSEPFADGWRAYGVPSAAAETAFEASIRRYPQLRGSWWWVWPTNTWKLDHYALDHHIVVNGFMQAWRVPFTGPYRVIVEYVPQREYEAGWLVTIGGLVCATFLAGTAAVRALIRNSIR